MGYRLLHGMLTSNSLSSILSSPNFYSLPPVVICIKLGGNYLCFVIGQMNAQFHENVTELISWYKSSMIRIHFNELATQVFPQVVDLSREALSYELF